ncbi:hypothetical protein SDC9_89313 [bioreactor metagenome]|uniref:Uncharacterized protein n=1 Tax=bioreactor metagenome TaxID=1076179 RepID=A0A644ZPG0_9ZZZZ
MTLGKIERAKASHLRLIILTPHQHNLRRHHAVGANALMEVCAPVQLQKRFQLLLFPVQRPRLAPKHE